MSPRISKRSLVAGGAAAVLVAGGGIAYAATTDSKDPSPAALREAVLDNAAKRLDVSSEKLRSALQGAFGDQLAEAVKSGRLTQQQADRIKQRLASSDGLPFGGFGHHGPHRGVQRAGVESAASYLGLSKQQLRSGKSLAEITSARGKSVDGLKAAIVAGEQQQLDQAVAKGRLTAQQRAKILKELDQRVSALVQRKGLDGPGEWHGGKRGDHGGRGAAQMPGGKS